MAHKAVDRPPVHRKGTRLTLLAAGVVLLSLLAYACTPGEDVAAPANGNGEGNGDGVALHEGEAYSWTIQSFTIAGTETHEWVERWAERVNRSSQGQIEMEVHAGGALVGLPDMLQATQEGVLDLMITSTGFFQGEDPAFGAWFGMPVLPFDEPELARYLATQWAYEAGGLELARELYGRFDVYPIGILLTANEPVHSRAPINTLEDFEGLRVRAAPGLVSDMFEEVGASPIGMPGGEIFTALDTGVIDATEFIGFTDNRGLGIDEVTDSALFPGFHSPYAITDVVVSVETWENLPEHLQLILEDSVLWLNRHIDHHMSYRDFETAREWEAEGVEITSLSTEDAERVRQIALEVTERFADESEMADRMINSMLDYLRFVGHLE